MSQRVCQHKYEEEIVKKDKLDYTTIRYNNLKSKKYEYWNIKIKPFY